MTSFHMMNGIVEIDNDSTFHKSKVMPNIDVVCLCLRFKLTHSNGSVFFFLFLKATFFLCQTGIEIIKCSNEIDFILFLDLRQLFRFVCLILITFSLFKSNSNAMVWHGHWWHTNEAGLFRAKRHYTGWTRPGSRNIAQYSTLFDQKFSLWKDWPQRCTFTGEKKNATFWFNEQIEK